MAELDEKHPAERLGQHMSHVCDAAGRLSKALRSGNPTLEIPNRFRVDPAPLFELAGPDGNTNRAVFHYTHDLKSLDPDAQVHLMMFFGNLHAVTTLLEAKDPTLNAAAIAMLDQVIAKAVFFERFFARLEITMDLLLARLPKDKIAQKSQDLAAEDQTRALAASEAMAEPGKISTYVPADDIPFLISAEGPGEMQPINGVPFPPDMAEQVLAHLAKQQAAALAERPEFQA